MAVLAIVMVCTLGVVDCGTVVLVVLVLAAAGALAVAGALAGPVRWPSPEVASG